MAQAQVRHSEAIKQRAQAIFLPPAAGEATHQRPDVAEARDLPHILPLSIVPLNTPGLRQARLVKNCRLETRIELFADQETGSGQIELGDLEDVFPSEAANLQKDEPTLRRLAGANSFDVYTLRRELRRLNLSVNDNEQLELSPQMARQLAVYMSAFTRPLIKQIYGDEVVVDTEITDLRSLATDPVHRKYAYASLKEMAAALKTDLNGVPALLEEYGEIYLSLAFFQACLAELAPVVESFMPWLEEVAESRAYGEDRSAVKMCRSINKTLGDVIASLNARFAHFEEQSQKLWNDFNADNFRQVSSLITGQHATIGGVLCGLILKMRDWRHAFPQGGGSPHKRMEFVKTEVRPGLDTIRDLEVEGRKQLRGQE